jgi:hypothetical protein
VCQSVISICDNLSIALVSVLIVVVVCGELVMIDVVMVLVLVAVAAVAATVAACKYGLGDKCNDSSDGNSGSIRVECANWYECVRSPFGIIAFLRILMGCVCTRVPTSSRSMAE